MKLTIIGSGYVGLVSAVCFADVGHQVLCVDNDRQKVERLQSGKLTIYEQGLDFLFNRVRREGRLKFTTSLEEGVKASSIYFLCLPTPEGENGEADLSHVLKVSEDIGTILEKSGSHEPSMVVTKSTVPVGTSERIRNILKKSAPQADVDVASNPEFMREGFAVEDFQRPSRVVIGSASPRALEILKELYGPFVRTGNPIYAMDERSSELTKYAANCYLAMRISFINEIATLCEAVSANVDDVRLAVGSDPRIGKQFLFPGLGYGGSCFPKDVRALIRTSQEFKSPMTLMVAANEANSQQRQRFCQKIHRHFKGQLAGLRFAVWGLAFKANTDDVRESPALDVIAFLLKGGAKVVAYDPEAMTTTRRILGDRIEYAASAHEAAMDADALIVATEWNEFRQPDLNFLKNRMKSPTVFDGRNLFHSKQLKNLGFTYVSVGRGMA
ncbi:MAG: UDP-glucose/GDP-mannose dehydrogenase family protein [Acidobacteriia bacterium]|nr:UDP-glucose/GDP-mannose dehydrogenase family protein [Terriglobia bacterium]